MTRYPLKFCEVDESAEKPVPCCERCDTEYLPDHHDIGICADCHDDAGEVWCEVCRRWAVGAKGETDACFVCLNKIHAEANRVDDEHHYMESA